MNVSPLWCPADRRVPNRLHVEAVDRAQKVDLPLHAVLVFKGDNRRCGGAGFDVDRPNAATAIARAIRIASS
jgi:hypothetical protein